MTKPYLVSRNKNQVPLGCLFGSLSNILCAMPRRKKAPKIICSPIASRIGVCVRKRREAMEISQEQLAETSGISKNYVGNIERGEYDATIGILARVAQSLHCRVADLLDEAGV